MRRSILLALALAALLPAACTIPGEDFQPNEEEPGPEALAIKVDVDGTLALDEGKSAPIAVSLSRAPSAPVMVVLDPSSLALKLDRAVLTFTADDFDRPQVVTVSTAEDDDAEGSSPTIALSIKGEVPVARTLGVHLRDLDQQQIDVRETGLSLREGRSALLGVRLRRRPLSPVTVTVHADAPGAVQTEPTAALTFDADSWNRYQDVSVVAAEDDDTLGEKTGLTLRIEALAIAVPVSVSIDDNDTQALQLSDSKLTLDEEAAGELTARLAFEPVGQVVVSVRSGNDGLVSDTEKLTFTVDNWKTPQPIKLRAPKDDDATSETGQLRVATDDGGLVGLVDTTVRDVVHRAQAGVFDPTISSEWSSARFNVIILKLTEPLTADRVMVMSLTTMARGARMAIYGDDGGKPGALLVTSPDIDLVATSWPRNGKMSPAAIPPTTLAAGTYWLAVQFNGKPADGATPAQIVRGTFGDLGYQPGCSVEGLPFGAPFPTSGWNCIEKMIRFTMAIEGDRRVAPTAR